MAFIGEDNIPSEIHIGQNSQRCDAGDQTAGAVELVGTERQYYIIINLLKRKTRS